MFVGPHRVVVVRHACRAALFLMLLSLASAGRAFAQARPASGGFLDSATSTGLRPRLSTGEIQTFMPQRGEFSFPSPYGTTGVRLTNASDCGGSDCVNYVGYSYWNNINNHAGSDTMLIFVGLFRSRGGAGPSLFAYNKRTGQTQNMGPLFSGDSAYSWESGEGWYFSATQPNSLYVFRTGGTSLERYDVINHTLTTVFDVASRADLFGGNRYIWQLHSSNDDRVHSGTLRDKSSYAMLGCFAYREDTKQFFYYPQKGDFDECQIDKSGRYLLIKEKIPGSGSNDVDNRIIDLQTGTEQQLLDRDGAGGHSDNGFASVLAADNMYPISGAVRLWHLDRDLRAPGQGTLVYETTDWAADVGHVSFSNARSDTPAERQYACGSNANRQNLPRANEIVCFRLDGSLNTLVVAPNLSDLNASGGGSDDYSRMPKGNLDVTGEWFVWSANSGTTRNDVYLVHIPVALLGATPGNATPPPPSPAPAPTPSPSPAPPESETPVPAPAPPAPGDIIRWSMLANVTANGNNLQKTGGCDGCADAGAVSEQRLHGDGSAQFKASEVGTLRVLGLTPGSLTVDPSAFAFALRLQGSVAEVRESGAYKADTGFVSGDVLKIAVESGSVKYSKNGVVFYTSAARAAFPLSINAALLNAGSTLTEITLSGPATSAPPSIPPTPAPPSEAPPSASPEPQPEAPDELGPALMPEASAGRVRQRWPNKVS